MDISRRNFIKGGLGLLGGLCLSQAQLLTLAATAYVPRKAGSRILIVVQLSGGNDGLNTAIPYGKGSYYQARPNLSIPPEQVLPITGSIGFNPNLSGLANLYKQGKLALLQAVGYPRARQSHFRCLEIWQTAEPDKIAAEGWLGQYLNFTLPDNPNMENKYFPAINVGPSLPKSLLSNKAIVPSVNSIYDFHFRSGAGYGEEQQRQILDLEVVPNYRSETNYPNNRFAHDLKFIAQMIISGVNSRIYHVNLDGFDTHANQIGRQNNLLKQLDTGLAALQADLEAHRVERDVLMLVFSEFGRQVAENSQQGTDHGAAEPVFIVGSSVKGGVYGDHPDLNHLDEGGLQYKIDFRSIYATVLDRWMGADSRQILGANYDQIAFL